MLSKKLKAKLNKIAVNATYAVSIVVVLFAMCVSLDSKVNIVKEEVTSNAVVASKEGNQVEITKGSDGINVQVRAEDSNGVTSIEVLQGGTSIGVYNYSGTNTQEEKIVKLSIPFGETKTVEIKVNGNTVKQEIVENMRCISTAQDLAKFRDQVNAGNDFSGKYVELTNDIDLSLVCSATVGNWVPIGDTSTSFSGTFNGNYHTINNLYINSSAGYRAGLFASIYNSVLYNVLLSNVQVINTYNVSSQDYTYTAGLCCHAGSSYIINCGIKDGNIQRKNVKNK